MSKEQRKSETRARIWRYTYITVVTILMFPAYMIAIIYLLIAINPHLLTIGRNPPDLANNWAAWAMAGTGTLLLFINFLRARGGRIERAPGGGLQRLAQLWFSKRVYGLVFEPILSDLREEYFKALAEGDRVKARFVLARGYGAFWAAFVAQLPVSLKKLVALWLASKIG